MRRKWTLAALLGVVMVAFAFGSAPRASAVLIPKQLNCNNYYSGGTYSSVLVQSGAECELAGVHVTGNVVVKPGGDLYVPDGTIDGNVISGGYLDVCNADIGKNVSITGSAYTYLGACDDVYIAGSLNVQNDSGHVYVAYNNITGGMHVSNNSGYLSFGFNEVGGAATFTSNTGWGFVGYMDAYDFQFLNNSGEFEIGYIDATHNALCRNNPSLYNDGSISAGNRNTCEIF